jgi:hypothetical protein
VKLITRNRDDGCPPPPQQIQDWAVKPIPATIQQEVDDWNSLKNPTTPGYDTMGLLLKILIETIEAGGALAPLAP